MTFPCMREALQPLPLLDSDDVARVEPHAHDSARLVHHECVDIEHQVATAALDGKIVRDYVLDQQPPRPRTRSTSNPPQPVAGHQATGSREAKSTSSATSNTVVQSATKYPRYVIRSWGARGQS